MVGRTLCLGILCCVIVQVLEADEPETGTDRHALLVGCSTYANLPDSRQLKGPKNDVRLMAKVLAEQFSFPATNIVTLESDASEADQKSTRANIEREFMRLAKIAGENDRVVVLMCGHGSQQPNLNPNEDPEPDGYDEIFLPSDVGEWDGTKRSVKNAITDDTIGQWVVAIRQKGAIVTLIVDSCHSGTIIRGTEVTRKVPAELLIPQQAIDAARTAETDEGVEWIPKAEDGIVAIYASQPDEPTIEDRFPRDAANAKRYGLLTYTLCQVVSEAQSTLTYRELLQAVRRKIAALGHPYPTPFVEGDLDRAVLGAKRWRGRSRILISRAGGGWTINVGFVHGLSTGSILRVHPPPSEANQDQLGYVKITACEALEAKVVPCEFKGQKPPEMFPPGSRCEVAFLDFGNQRLRLYVNAKVPKMLVKQVQQLAETKGTFIELSDDLSRADWHLQIDNGELFLVPRTGIPVTRGDASQPLPKLFGPIPEAKFQESVERKLRQVARATNLLRIVADDASRLPDVGDLAAEVRLRKYKNQQDRKGQIVQFEPGGTVLKNQELVRFEIENNSEFSIDATLLFVSSTYKISAFYPSGNYQNQILPGMVARTKRIHVIADDAIGPEHMLLLAVKSKGVPVNFACLAQPGLAEAATTRGGGVLESPLGQLFKSALYQASPTRGLEFEDTKEFGFRILTWKVAK